MKVFVILLLLCACRAGFAEEAGVLDFLAKPDAWQPSSEELREAQIFRNVIDDEIRFLAPDHAVGKVIERVWIEDQMLLLLENMDFSRCRFIGGCMVETIMKNVSFEDAVFLPPKNEPVGLEGEFYFRGENINMKNAYFVGRKYLYISGANFIQTRNYQIRDTKELFIRGDFSDTDLRGFRFYGVEFMKAKNTLMDGLDFQSAVFHAGITAEQIVSTRPYQNGVFHDVSFRNGCGFPKDCRNISFIDCHIAADVSKTDFTDSKWFNSWASLTLEQVKSTWNYKTGNMNPIMSRQLSDLEKAKAQEEKK